MAAFEALLTDIAEMQEAIQTLKQRLKAIPSEMAQELTTEAERVDAARYLYWTYPELSSVILAKELLGLSVRDLKLRLGPQTHNLQCEQCQAPVSFQTRTALPKLLESKKRGWPSLILCEPCCTQEKNQRREQNEAWCRQRREQEAEARRRLYELHTMPYPDYLQTPEWRERRGRHLASVGFRCQVCNTPAHSLDVHHRTYERRGCEHYTDLLALCRGCHALFHREGRLAWQ